MDVREHIKECELEQVGRCVYCKEHGTRLYQGRLPESDEAKSAIIEFFDAVDRRRNGRR